MRIISTLLLIGFLVSLASAQSAGLEQGQTWNVTFQDSNTWQLSLDTANEEGFVGSATSSSFGATLEAAMAPLNAEDLAFLGLTGSGGDYVGALLTYPAAVATANGGDLLMCAFTASDLQGQAFELRQESTGLRVVAAGTTCSAQQNAVAPGATASAWPPALSVGETWQLSVTQGGAEVAAWTVQITGSEAARLTGSATGTDDRLAELEYIRENPPAPSLLNTWVFALSGADSNPLYCTFPQDKPHTATSMTGSVMLMEATCTATKQ